MRRKNFKCVDENFETLYTIEPSKLVENKFMHLPEGDYHKNDYVEFMEKKGFPIENPRVKISVQSENKTVDCRAKQQEEIFISSDFKLWPCCWLHIFYTQHEWRETESDLYNLWHHQLELSKNFNSLHHYSLTEIIESNALDSIEKTWNT